MLRITVLIAFLAAVAPSAAVASLVASIGASEPIFAGQTGQFEVFLENTAIGPDEDAIVYQVGFDIVTPGEPGSPYEASFTGDISTLNTTELYIFPTSFGAVPVATSDPADPTLFTYGDFSSTPGTPQPIVAGDRYSLGFVSFTGMTPGTYTVNFTEATVDSIPISTVVGSITVLPAAVPEPGTALLLGLTGIVGLAVSRSRRKRAGEPTAPCDSAISC